MRWKKRIRVNRDGVSVAADVNLVVNVNRQQAGATSRVSGFQTSAKASEPGGTKEPDEPKKRNGDRKEPF